MKKKDVFKQLMPGVVVGLILGFVLTLIVGVSKEDPIPNYIGGAMCCFVPTLLNCIIVLKGTAKTVDRKLILADAIKRTVPYAIASLILGFLVVAVIVEKVLGINTCELTTIVTAIYQSILGVIVSTLSAYLAIKKYLAQVKYTRRNK